MFLNPFVQLAFLTIFTLFVSYILKLLKQPLLLGYIIAGILLGPNVLNLIQNTENVHTLSEIGIAFLLFMVGLSLNPTHIREIGKPAAVSAILHTIISVFLAWLVGIIFNFTSQEALLIGFALTFSSTIIITKILSDRHELETVYGKMVSGFLIFQDVLAMFFLIYLSALGEKGDNLLQILISTFLSGFGIICLLIAFSWTLLPKITAQMAKSQELLMLFSISWCLVIATIFYYLGFSFEIGALTAGITLSVSPYRYEISTKVKTLRDFFIVLFFVLVGAKMSFAGLENMILPMIAFTLLVLVGTPIIMTLVMGYLGFTKKIAFQIGLSLAQVSEFSLIILATASAANLISTPIVSMITLILLITATASAYFIRSHEFIYNKIHKLIPFIQVKNKAHSKAQHEHVYDSILLGYSKFGSELLDTIKSISNNFLIVDFNPSILTHLSQKKLPHLYADISNLTTQEDINLDKCKMVVSTIKDFNINLTILKHIRKTNQDSIVITLAHQLSEALELYENGADYVIIPSLIGAHHTATLISEFKSNPEKFQLEKKQHLNKLLIKKQTSPSGF